MNAQQFYNLVKEMRKAQKRFFFSKEPADLQQAKKCEREIDEEIKRVEKILKQRRQQNLPI